jgi:hypothetical protein
MPGSQQVMSKCLLANGWLDKWLDEKASLEIEVHYSMFISFSNYDLITLSCYGFILTLGTLGLSLESIVML